VDSVLADEEEKKRWKNYFLNFIYLSPDKNRTFFYEKTIYFSSLNLSDYILILVPEKATQLAYTLFSTRDGKLSKEKLPRFKKQRKRLTNTKTPFSNVHLKGNDTIIL
jgi:hypothetical protein